MHILFAHAAPAAQLPSRLGPMLAAGDPAEGHPGGAARSRPGSRSKPSAQARRADRSGSSARSSCSRSSTTPSGAAATWTPSSALTLTVTAASSDPRAVA